MNIFKKYRTYLKDNPQGFWFKRKLFGWGWTPVKWQGWAVVLVYVMLILALALSREKSVPGNPDSGSNFVTFALPIIVLTILFIVIAYKKGEKPRFQWGFPPEKTDANK
jgi:hypothetical protein